MTRKCGECTLCCKLTPIVELRKPGPSFLKLANQKCPFQRFHKGCTIYDDIQQRPRACFVWRCRWLMSDEGTESLPRPDRAGFVIDEVPDMMTIFDHARGQEISKPAIQIWVGNTEGGKMPASLKAYMEHMGSKGYGIICRFDEKRAMASAIINGSWKHEATIASIQHAPADIAQVWREHGLA